MWYVLSCILSCLLLLSLTLLSTSVLLHLVESNVAGSVVIYFRHLTAGIERCCRIKVLGYPFQFPCDHFYCYTWLIPTVLECIWSWSSKMQWRVSRLISVSESVSVLRRQFRQHKLKLNSVALVRERTIPTERPPPVGEVSANFCG
jgi:hypothetical protein